MRTTRRWAKWISNLYRDVHPSHRYYVLSKLLTDDLTKTLTTLKLTQLDTRTHMGRVLDVGCGRGQFDFLTALFNNVDSIKGVDLDARKVEVAQAAVKRWNQILSDPIPIEFEACDATELPSEQYDSIFFFDVLNTLIPVEQTEVLGELASRLSSNGRLFLRESLRGEGPMYSKWLEPIARRLGTNVGRDMAFPSEHELYERISDAGLSVLAEHKSPVLKSRFLVLSVGGVE